MDFFISSVGMLAKLKKKLKKKLISIEKTYFFINFLSDSRNITI